MKASDSSLSDSTGEGVPLLEKDSSPLSKFRILAICSAMMGIQFSYTVEFTFVTPQLAELGVPTWAIPFVWLAGPLSGLVVQPVVGVWSDRCLAKWGKRRPFIFVGAIFTVLGMLLLAFAETLGHLLSPGNWKIGAIVFTVCPILSRSLHVPIFR
jgi:Na+/melibiose symporter-like transporter